MGKKNRNQRKRIQTRNARMNLQQVREEAQQKAAESNPQEATDTPLEDLGKLVLIENDEPETNPQEQIELKRSARKIDAPTQKANTSAPAHKAPKPAQPKENDFEDEDTDDLKTGPFSGVVRDGHFNAKTGELTGVSILAKNPINGNPQIYTAPAQQLPDGFEVRPEQPVEFRLKRGSKGNIIAIYVEYIRHDVIQGAAKRAAQLVNKLVDERKEQAETIYRWTPAMVEAALLNYLQDHPEESETDADKLLSKAGYMLIGMDHTRFVLVKA